MSTEAWIGLTGILVTVSLTFFGTVAAVVGWLLSRLINGVSDRVDLLDGRAEDFGERLTVVETVLRERGLCQPSGGRHKTSHLEGPQQ